MTSLHTIAIGALCFSLLGLYFGVLQWVLLILFFPLMPLVGPYLIWIWVLDRSTPSKGGRPIPFLRKLKIWKYISEYFPAKVILQEPLDPSKAYIFVSHPHGLFVWGVWTNMLNDSNNIQDLLKGLSWRLITLDTWFLIPIMREFLLAFGFVSASRESCEYLLSHGISPLIVVGGAKEALDARSGTNKLLLKRRKGFIKLALQYGANLVPMFTFGENELYHPLANPPGSLLRRLQNWTKDKVRFEIVYFPGRGYLPIPIKHELVTVIGSPIEVRKKEPFDETDVNELHEKYMAALADLYSEYAGQYANGVKLEIA